MKKGDFDFWCDYHNGLIKRKLTIDEQKEINASDFAMHLLVSSEVIEKISKKYGSYQTILNDSKVITALADYLKVPREVVIFKVKYMIKEELKTSDNKVIHLYNKA